MKKKQSIYANNHNVDINLVDPEKESRKECRVNLLLGTFHRTKKRVAVRQMLYKDSRYWSPADRNREFPCHRGRWFAIQRLNGPLVHVTTAKCHGVDTGSQPLPQLGGPHRLHVFTPCPEHKGVHGMALSGSSTVGHHHFTTD